MAKHPKHKKVFDDQLAKLTEEQRNDLVYGLVGILSFDDGQMLNYVATTLDDIAQENTKHYLMTALDFLENCSNTLGHINERN